MRAVLLAVCSLLLCAGCGGNGDDGSNGGAEAPATTEEHEMGEPVELELVGVNESGLSGTAMLVEGTGSGIESFEVRLNLAQDDDESRPAHIHNVTCAEYGKITDFDGQLKTVADTLANVDDGVSTSTVPGKLSERTTGEYSINVHSPANPFPAVACGDIPEHGG